MQVRFTIKRKVGSFHGGASMKPNLTRENQRKVRPNPNSRDKGTLKIVMDQSEKQFIVVFPHWGAVCHSFSYSAYTQVWTASHLKPNISNYTMVQRTTIKSCGTLTRWGWKHPAVLSIHIVYATWPLVTQFWLSSGSLQCWSPCLMLKEQESQHWQLGYAKQSQKVPPVGGKVNVVPITDSVHIQEETHMLYNEIWYSLLIRHLRLVLRHTSLVEGSNNVSHGFLDKKVDQEAISGRGAPPHGSVKEIWEKDKDEEPF